MQEAHVRQAYVAQRVPSLLTVGTGKETATTGVDAVFGLVFFIRNKHPRYDVGGKGVLPILDREASQIPRFSETVDGLQAEFPESHTVGLFAAVVPPVDPVIRLVLCDGYPVSRCFRDIAPC